MAGTPTPSSTTMASNPFHELKKQASSFLKDKIRTARLALTDVTPAQLLTEEATKGNPWAPDARTMGFISRAAFEIDDYWRIVEILHKRLEKFDRKHWRETYNATVLLEHLLTHGPESVAEEFRSDRRVIQDMGAFQCVDARGFNWGFAVQQKSERILKLLEKGTLLKEERDRARKVSRVIQGFGSLNQRWASTDDGNTTEQNPDGYGRSNSHYENFCRQQENTVGAEKENSNSDAHKIDKNENTATVVSESPLLMTRLPVDESKSLLTYHEEEARIEVHKEHPFQNLEHQRIESTLLLGRT